MISNIIFEYLSKEHHIYSISGCLYMNILRKIKTYLWYKSEKPWKYVIITWCFSNYTWKSLRMWPKESIQWEMVQIQEKMHRSQHLKELETDLEHSEMVTINHTSPPRSQGAADGRGRWNHSKTWGHRAGDDRRRFNRIYSLRQMCEAARETRFRKYFGFLCWPKKYI